VKALIASSRYADAIDDNGWGGGGPSRFESRYHRLCTPDRADSMRNGAVFLEAVTVPASVCRELWSKVVFGVRQGFEGGGGLAENVACLE